MTAEEDGWRAVARRVLGIPEPEPATGNVVPSEGAVTPTPRPTPTMFSRDFLRRLTTDAAAYDPPLDQLETP